MGQFRMVVEAVGGHGCKRTPRKGERVFGCRRMDCPDCAFADFVERLARSGSGFDLKATLTHWPGQPSEVVDELRINERGGVEVTRAKGSFEQIRNPDGSLVGA